MALLFVVGGLFAATVVVAWLALFPTGRDALSNVAVTLGFRIHVGVRRWWHGAACVSSRIYASVWHPCIGAGRYLLRHFRVAAAVVVLLGLPPLVIMQLHYDLDFAGTGVETTAVDKTLITRLLRGERLVPLSQPVPAMFRTRGVKLIRPALPGANRDWSRLDAQFRQRLLVVYKLMREKYGYNMVLIEGYRSPQRQRMLARKEPGVTNAGAFESYHQYGLAADSAFLRNGELVISAENKWAMRGYRLYGGFAEAVGLTWGGDWQLHDYGHVELRRPGVLQ